MAIDIIGYINTAWTEATTQEKLDLLDDFCEQYGYSDITNPPSKKYFANQKIVQYIKDTVNARRDKVVKDATSYTELDGTFVPSD